MNDDDDDDGDVSKNSLFNRVYLALKMRWRPSSLSPVQKYIHQKCDNRRRRRRKKKEKRREREFVGKFKEKEGRPDSKEREKSRSLDTAAVYILYCSTCVSEAHHEIASDPTLEGALGREQTSRRERERRGTT